MEGLLRAERPSEQSGRSWSAAPKRTPFPRAAGRSEVVEACQQHSRTPQRCGCATATFRIDAS
eukprot:4558807-Prymnesium_polylepis.1